MSLWFALAPAFGADLVVVRVAGMDCSGCLPAVERAFAAVDGVAAVRASFDSGIACLELSKPVSAEILTAALVGVEELKVTAVEPTAECPLGSPRAPHEPWREVTGLDVSVVSRGDAIKLSDHFAAGKFTLVDFGAPWCGPCRGAESELRAYLDEHEDVAVRAVVLPGKQANESFASPVARQHLASAVGLPWVMVYSPSGKRVYAGGVVSEAVAAIESARAR